MGIWDIVESAAGGIADVATTVGPVARRLPGSGEALSALQAGYHTGSAIYDGVTGDRDGAVNHGTQALVNGIGAIPGVPEVYGALEIAGAGAGTVARTAAESEDDSVLGTVLGGAPWIAGRMAREHGVPTEDIPGGIDDLAGSLAVMGTNAIFGADDSNWIADGDTPQGTRAGEIAAGAAGVGALLGGGWGLGALMHGVAGWHVGNAIGERTSPDQPTSGATPGTAAQIGQAIHDVATGEDIRDEQRDARREAGRREMREQAERTRPRAPGDPVNGGQARIDQMGRDMPRPRAPGDPVNGGQARIDQMGRDMQAPVVPGTPSSSLDRVVRANREVEVATLAQRAGVLTERLMRPGPDGWIYDEAAIRRAEAAAAERGR